MMNWIRRATETLTLESNAIRDLIPLIGDDFIAVGKLLFQMKGRVVMTGIGKSAIIAQKLVATFNSTGTPAIFMHAADAIHGDLGLVQKDDLVLCISKSGNSPEIKALVPLLKSRNISLIGMVGNIESHLALQSDVCSTPPFRRKLVRSTSPLHRALRHKWRWEMHWPPASWKRAGSKHPILPRCTQVVPSESAFTPDCKMSCVPTKTPPSLTMQAFNKSPWR
jgi:D-arabinose 5-phosphate isomerase GutQ